MEREPSAFPRKLVEAAFRNWMLLLIPILAVPALVVFLVKHDAVYESTGTAWVTDLDGLGSSSFTDQASSSGRSPAERQVEILADLLATRSFREDIAVEAALVAADAPATEIAAAAETLPSRMAAVASGPNLVTIKASAESADEAQRIAAAYIALYQLRAQTDTAREAATILIYFDGQVAQAEADVARTRAATAGYLAANPAVATAPDAEYQRLLALGTVQESLLSRVLESQKDAQLSAAALTAGAQSIFVVEDVPEAPVAALGVPLMTRVAYPAAGLLLGAFISAACLWLIYRGDRTIRGAGDIDTFDVTVLGEVPELAPGDLARRFTPLRWAGFLKRDYARRVAASIPPSGSSRKEAS